MEQMYIIAFNSTHHAMRSEKLIKKEEISIGIMPTPREISASCGLSIRFEEKDLNEVRKIISVNNLDYKGIYKISKLDDGKRKVEEI